MQHDFIDLLTFFSSRDEDDELREDIESWSLEYVEDHPDTPLRSILETMGRKGPVTIGVGTTIGSGIGVVIDSISDLSDE